MKKSELKAIIRECLEEVLIDEKRGKKGVRPVNKQLKADISAHLNAQTSDDQEDADHGRRALYRADRHGSTKHLYRAERKDNRQGLNSGPGRGQDPLTLRTKAPAPARSGPRKGKIDKKHIEKMKIRMNPKTPNYLAPKGKLP
jgi:hypothetical protein